MKRRSLLLGAAASALSAGASQVLAFGHLGALGSRGGFASLGSSGGGGAGAWSSKRPFTVDNTGNASTLGYYQTSIVITSSNFDFSVAKADGGDLRVTDSDGTTLLPYWVQAYDSVGQTAVVWALVPSITGSASKTLYIYSGNPRATSLSSFQNVFIFGDDFSTDAGWQRNPSGVTNPVLTTAAATWESSIVGDPCLIYDATASTYRMWYFGYNGSIGQIGYATSPDGKVWTKYVGNPVLTVGSAGTYDDTNAIKPHVVLQGGTYYMFYSATKNGGDTSIAVAMATAPEGPWTKYASNPILIPDHGAIEGIRLDCPSVLYDSDVGLWKMWYSAGRASIPVDEPKYFCYATASSPFGPWTKYVGNPIAQPTNDGFSWLSRNLGGQRVTKLANGTYENYYNAQNEAGASQIGYMTSSDGVTWRLQWSDLALPLGYASWENSQVYRPCGLTVGGVTRMWYNAKGSTEQIGYAEFSAAGVAGINPARWRQTGTASSPAVSGGVLTMNDASTSVSSVMDSGGYAPADNTIIETRGKIVTVNDATNCQIYYQLFTNTYPIFGAGAQFGFASKDTNTTKHQSRNGGVFGSEDTIYASMPTTGQFYKMKNVKLASGMNWYFYDASSSLLGSLVGNTDPPVAISYPVSFGCRAAQVSFDFILVRQYTTPEPSTSLGSSVAGSYKLAA